ncbi:MAG: LutC/YkgG family protein [Helicobacteraceae bacterium]
MSKESILSKISGALNTRSYTKQDIGKAYEHVKGTGGDELEQFKTKLVANKTVLFEVQKAQVSATLKKILADIGARKLVYGRSAQGEVKSLDLGSSVEALLYEKTANDLGEGLFDYDTSIIHASFGVANMGVFCVLSSPEQPRLLSLTPKNSIVLLKKENVKPNMKEVFDAIGSAGEVLPSNILFIAGPSRTADIELQVVMGVHGPQAVYLVLY